MKRTYTLTFRGRTHAIASRTFWGLGVPLLLGYGIYFGIFIYFGCHALGYLSGLPSLIAGILYVVLTARVTLTNYQKPGDAEYGLLPSRLTQLLHYTTFGYTLYYLATMQRWPLWGVLLLSLPALHGLWHNLMPKK